MMRCMRRPHSNSKDSERVVRQQALPQVSAVEIDGRNESILSMPLVGLALREGLSRTECMPRTQNPTTNGTTNGTRRYEGCV